MARTYKKQFKMDTSTEFPSFLALEELEFFPTLSPALGECDDVFDGVTLKDHLGDDQDFSAGDILQELDLQGGDSFLETDWLTDKFNFSSFDPTLAGTSETLAELTKVEEAPVENSILEDGVLLKAIQDSCFTGIELFPAEVEMLSPHEQKVPEYEALSPYSLSSPGSFMTDESNPPSPSSSGDSRLDDISVTDLLTTETLTLPDLLLMSKTDAIASKVDLPENTESKAKTFLTPYMRDSTSTELSTVKPKVKSPAQKQRKRVQNKDAATRYRVKKRSEQDQLFDEASELEKENGKLRDKVGSLGKEIEYLKNLMIEVYRTKKQKQKASLKEK